MDHLFQIFDSDINIYNTDAKRRKAKRLNFTYLWHRSLSDVKKRIKETPLWWNFGVNWVWIFWQLRIFKTWLKHCSRPNKERSTTLLEILHADVCCTLCVVVRGGFFYFIILPLLSWIDIWVFLFDEIKEEVWNIWKCSNNFTMN